MWEFNGVKITDELFEEYRAKGVIGFIYRITNLTNGRKYIGKKQWIQKVRLKPLKGQTKYRHVEKVNDWKTYCGQNQELQDEVASLGEDKFRREIIKFCFQKQECNYEETRYIMEERALFSDVYYNSWFQCKITKKHVQSALKKNKF